MSPRDLNWRWDGRSTTRLRVFLTFAQNQQWGAGQRDELLAAMAQLIVQLEARELWVTYRQTVWRLFDADTSLPRLPKVIVDSLQGEDEVTVVEQCWRYLLGSDEERAQMVVHYECAAGKVPDLTRVFPSDAPPMSVEELKELYELPSFDREA